MATEKQTRALEEMVENGGVASRAMLEAGYSPNTAKTPQKLTASNGFLELCEERGLTDELLVSALLDDIREKRGNRRAELELGFRIKGRLVHRANITSGDKQIASMQVAFDSVFDKADA